VPLVAVALVEAAWLGCDADADPGVKYFGPAGLPWLHAPTARIRDRAPSTTNVRFMAISSRLKVDVKQ
jgi:hypothetical protein